MYRAKEKKRQPITRWADDINKFLKNGNILQSYLRQKRVDSTERGLCPKTRPRGKLLM